MNAIMITANITLGENIQIDPSSTVNNVAIGNNVKIAKLCSIFGSPEYAVKIGNNSYIGMMSIINGYNAQIIIGERVSFAQHVNLMTDSGPNASPMLQKIFPIQKGSIEIGDDSWIGADSIIMPNVTLGKCCIVAANSFVTNSFESFSVIGGNPAKLIRKLTVSELHKMGLSENNRIDI